MKKLILFFTDGNQATEQELEVGRSISAQFRNVKLVDPENLEKPVYVAGHVPECYANVPVHPSAAEVTVLPDTGSDTPVEAQTPASDDSAGSDDDEITEESLEEMTKAELIDFAEANDIELDADDKKNKASLVAAVFDALQE